MRIEITAGLALITALTACQASGPEVLVVVDTDLAVPGDFDGLYAGLSEDQAAGPDDDRWQPIGLGAVSWPFSFVARPGHGGPVGIHLEARRGDEPILRRQVVIDVPESGTYRAAMFLAGACRTTRCPEGQSCGERGCVDVAIEQRQAVAGQELADLCHPGATQCRNDGGAQLSCPVFGEPPVEEVCPSGASCEASSGRCQPSGPRHLVTVVRSGPGAGRVTSNPTGLDCGTSCTLEVAGGTSLSLQVIPEQGSIFGTWRGACLGQANPCTIMVNGPVQVEAELITGGSGPSLSVSLSGTGSGRISSGDARIDCGNTCDASYTQSTPVVLTAEASSGSHFVAWTGPCTGSGNVCNVTVGSPIHVDATFMKDNTGAPGPYDFNGDGPSDLIFAAPRRDGPNGVDSGRVYVIFGPPPNVNSGAELAPLHYDGPGPNARFGEAVAFAPDLSGDAQPDLVVGAPGFNGGKGGLIVIPGGTRLIGTLNGAFPTDARIIDGDEPESGFGATILTDLDYNKDGHLDLIVGAPGTATVGGKVYVFFGSATGLTAVSTSQASVVILGEVGDRFGSSLASAPDLDGDGADELLVGAPEGGAATPTGRAYVFKGASEVPNRGVETADMAISGFPGSRLGAAIAGLGDFNGDGRGDFAVGAPGRNTVYLFFGMRAGFTDANSAQRILAGNGLFGIALNGKHDYDGDGFLDLVVGSPDDGGPGFGRVSLFRGRQPSSAPDFTVGGNCAGASTCTQEGFGSSVGPAGDLDGDEILDLAVGSRFGGGVAGPSGRGRVTVHRFAAGASSEQWSEDGFVRVIGEAEAQGGCTTVLGGRSL